MAYQVEVPHMSLREIERAILVESSGATDEDLKNLTYAVRNAPEVMLHRQALAKKLLKAFLVNLGFDPAVRNKYGVDRKTDWDEHRSRVARDDPNRKRKLRRISEEEKEEAQALSETDTDAWREIRALEDVIARRAYALEKLDLVDCDVSGMCPNEVSVPFPDSVDSPWEGTIQITEAGLRFLASGKTLRERPRQTSVDPLDRELEIAEDAKGRRK